MGHRFALPGSAIVDGEGSLSLSRRHRREHRQLVISISSTEPQLLKSVHTAIGAGRITNKRAAWCHHTPNVTYVIDNRQALALLEQIAPYLRTYKTQRAAFILNDYVRLTPRNGKYGPAQLREREVFIERFLLLNPRRHAGS